MARWAAVHPRQHLAHLIFTTHLSYILDPAVAGVWILIVTATLLNTSEDAGAVQSISPLHLSQMRVLSPPTAHQPAGVNGIQGAAPGDRSYCQSLVHSTIPDPSHHSADRVPQQGDKGASEESIYTPAPWALYREPSHRYQIRLSFQTSARTWLVPYPCRLQVFRSLVIASRIQWGDHYSLIPLTVVKS